MDIIFCFFIFLNFTPFIISYAIMHDRVLPLFTTVILPTRTIQSNCSCSTVSVARGVHLGERFFLYSFLQNNRKYLAGISKKQKSFK